VFDPQQFLRLAQELARRGDNEAATRTAVSRAYYAAFLQAELWLEAQGIVFTKSAADHRTAVRELRQIDRFVGDALQSLRRSRNMADYDVSKPVLDNQVRDALLAATIVIQRTQLYAQ
jgi:uncharacterized protein (UPF0332 family)